VPADTIENRHNLLFDVPSMRMLMKRICIAFKGLLKPKKVLNVIKVKAATAVLSWNERKFWILWNIDFPNPVGVSHS
jgi:hypothetical protein